MTDTNIFLAWKVVSSLGTELPLYERNGVFKANPNPALYTGNFRVPLEFCYVPHSLSLSIHFHEAVKRLLGSHFGIHLKNKGFPYALTLPGIGEEILLHIKHIRYYPPGILAMTVELTGLPYTSDASALIDYQQLAHNAPVSQVIRWTLGIIDALDLDSFSIVDSFTSKPFLHIHGICTAEALPSHFERNASKYVGILIRNRQYEFMSGHIPENILGKNKELNTKSSEKLLIDKQGILYLTPADIPKVYSRRQVHDLCEIALVMEAFLNNYSSFRVHNEDFADFILSKIWHWIEQPNAIISRSVSHQHIWNLMVEEFIKSRRRYLSNGELLSLLGEKSETFDQITGSWWDERDFAHLIAQRVQGSRGLRLDFLESDALVNILLEDYAEARRSFQCKNYKAATMLCGSIMEAILLSTLRKRAEVSNQSLFDLINMARKEKLITDDDLVSQLHALRRYRNLIHPAEEERREFRANEHIAAIAIRYIYILVEHLNRNLS
jgi:hypothetical protein